jgi:hypothetical protein
MKVNKKIKDMKKKVKVHSALVQVYTANFLLAIYHFPFLFLLLLQIQENSNSVITNPPTDTHARTHVGSPQ